MRAEFAGLLVVQGVDHGTQAQDVGQQDELLAPRRAGLANGGQELDPLQPFLGGQVHLAGEGVQMPHRRLADFLQARIVRAGHLGQRLVRDGEFVQILHVGLPGLICALQHSAEPALFATRRAVP